MQYGKLVLEFRVPARTYLLLYVRDILRVGQWMVIINYRGTNRMKSEQIRMVLAQYPDPEPLPSPNPKS